MSQNGEFYINTELNTDGVRQGAQEINQQMDETANAASNAAQSIDENISNAFEDASTSAQESASRIVDSINEINEAATNTAGASDSLNRIPTGLPDAMEEATTRSRGILRDFVDGFREGYHMEIDTQNAVDIGDPSAAMEGGVTGGNRLIGVLSKLSNVATAVKANFLEFRTAFRQGFAEGAQEASNGGIINGLKRIGSSALQGAKNILGIGKNAKRAANGLKSLLKYGLGITTLVMLFRKLRQAVAEGLKNLAQYDSKTNASISSITSALATLKNALATAFAPILNVISPIITAFINKLVALANTIGMVLAKLGGSNTFIKATAQQKDYAKSLDKTGKSASKSVLSIDELNQSVEENDSASAAGAGGGDVAQMFEEVPIDEKASEWASKLGSFFAPIKASWDTYGQAVIEAWQYALESVKRLVGDIGRSFLEVWNNGSGEHFLGNILRIIADIGLFIGNIATQLDEAWNKNNIGTQLFQDIFDILNLITDTLVNCADYTVEWSSTLDFYPLLESIHELLQSIKDVLAPILEVGQKIYTDIILPIIKWVIESALPEIIKTISKALELVAKVLKDIEPIAMKLIDEVIKPIGEKVGELVIDALESIGDALEWIAGNEIAVTILEALAIAIGLVVGAVTLWNVAGAIAAGVATALGAAIAILTSPITLVILAITALVTAGILLYKNWDTVKAKANEIWSKIVTKISGAIDSMKEKFENFKKGVEEIWDGITGAIKTAINAILSGIEKFCNGVIKGINTVINALNSLQIDVPDWITEKFGITSFGFNITPLNEVKLPRLASGTVVPRQTSEFAAILGDNNREAEVVSPLSTIQEAVANVMGEYLPYLQQLVTNTEIIADKDVEVVIGDRDIAQANRRGEKLLGYQLTS